MKIEVVSREVYDTYSNGKVRRYIPNLNDEESYERRRRMLLRKQEFKALLDKENLKNFIHILHDTLELRKRDIARVIYLSTYMDNTGKLLHGNNRPITKKDLGRILNISECEKRKLYNRLKEANILYEYDKFICINSKYFCKGKTKNNNYSRMFINTIRELYEKVDINSLALVYKILPYVSYWHNVLCFKPSEKITDEIQAMTCVNGK